MGRGKRQGREHYDYWAHQRREEEILKDPERARCCPAPDFAIPRGHVYRQRCRTCGTWHGGASLAAARELERHPASKCAHEGVGVEENWILGTKTLGQPWHCPKCHRYWRARPVPHQAGEEHGAFFKQWLDDWEVATGLIHLRMQTAASEAAKARPRSRLSSLGS